MVLATGDFVIASVLEARFLSDVDVQKFAASGTWNKPTGAQWVLIEIQAAGGPGGGAGITGASQWSIGDGGGGGEYARVLVPAASLTASVTVTVGLGGVGVTTGAGLVGGTTSFGAYLTAIGGGSGSQRAASGTLNFSSASLQRIGGTGGAGSLTADLRVPGCAGGSGLALGFAGATNVRGGDGGASFWGGATPAPDGHQVGQAGKIYGGGGSGVGHSQSQVAARASGSGADGRVIITTWI
jgi:hypothetical protein